jgi:hypothetical protein
MRMLALFAFPLVAALAGAGCSNRTQENAEKTAEAAKQDVGGAAAQASGAIDNAADAVGSAAGEAVDSASTAADRMGEKLKEDATRTRARIHKETAPDR